MTIITTQARVTYAGDNVSTLFPVPFEFFLNSDLTVVKNAVGGAVVTLVLNLDYTLTNAGVPGGGTLTKTTALLTGETMAIFLNPPIEQESHYISNSPFPASTLENDIDRQTQISQRLQDQISRALRAPDGDPASGTSGFLLPSSIARAGTYLTFDVNGNPTLGVSIPAGTLSAASIGAFIGPQTPAEAAAGVTIVAPWLPTGNMLRYGVAPNSPAAATTNTAIVAALHDPTKNGPTGYFWFPNTTGNDTYYFNQSIQLHDDVTWDLNGTTLSFSATYDASWNFKAFLRFIRDVTIQNGNISVNFNGSSGTNAGMVMLIGSRSGYPFGAYPNGIFDQTDLIANSLPPMGNITLRNLRITTNNPSNPTGPSEMILMFGGLRNVTAENLVFNGQGVCNYGIYYEFGFASQNSFPADQTKWTSSHATAMRFTNIVATNMGTTVAIGGGAVGLGGAHDAILENLIVDSAVSVFTYTPGEALFYRPWSPTDLEGAKRSIIIRNPVGSNILGAGLVLTAASAVAGSYLHSASPALTLSQQVDLMTFDVEGGAINAAAEGMLVSGAINCLNIKLDGIAASSQVLITDDCLKFNFENCDILNSSSFGFRVGFAGVFANRQKLGNISRCLIAGNTIGIVGNNIQAMRVQHCRIGYNTAWDAAAETTQTQACNLAATCENCKFDSNVASIGAGATAYVTVGLSSGVGNELINPMTINAESKITATAGAWDIDGMALATATQIASATSVVNLNNKYLARKVYDTNNKRILVAQGPAATDQWELCDGTVAITPV